MFVLNGKKALRIRDIRKPKVKDTGIEIGSVGRKNKAKNENTPVKKPRKIGVGEWSIVFIALKTMFIRLMEFKVLISLKISNFCSGARVCHL